MQGYSVLLRESSGSKLEPRALDFIQRITKSAERFDLLIRDVLMYTDAARTQVSLKPIDLAQIVEDILQTYPDIVAGKEHIIVKPPLPVVYGHSALLAQALSNLLSNALKFVPPARIPRVRLWSEATRAPQTTTSSGGNEWVRICVEDNGIGIAGEHQQRVFGLFQRICPPDQYPGAGMGLAIAQKAIERMGGRIGVKSAEGQGSQFWLQLRRAEPKLLEAGDSGYLLKQDAGDLVVHSIRDLPSDGNAPSPPITGPTHSRQAEITTESGRADRPEQLTLRQAEVLQLIAEGLSSLEIAKAMSIGIRTIDTHRQNLMDKLNIHNIAGLTRFFFGQCLRDQRAAL